MTPVLILVYLGAIVTANLLATADPRWIVINAFVLIGLDLVARDKLDDRWREHRLLKMGALVIAGSAIAYALNADAKTIAIASAAAFGAAFTVDWLVYSQIRHLPWLERANWSNIPSSAVDSIVFPLLAFPTMDWLIVASLFAAKVGGGAVWSLLLKPHMEPQQPYQYGVLTDPHGYRD